MCPTQVHEGRYDDLYVPKRGYDRFGEPTWPNFFPHWVRPSDGPTWSLPLRRATDFIGRGLYTVLYLVFPRPRESLGCRLARRLIYFPSLLLLGEAYPEKKSASVAVASRGRRLLNDDLKAALLADARARECRN